MDNLKIILGQWQKLMEKYDKNSMKLQRKISDIIKKEWTTSNTRSESDLKKFIERSGMSNIKILRFQVYFREIHFKGRGQTVSIDACIGLSYVSSRE